MVDPLAADGGSEKVIKSELQAIDDLQKMIVKIRSAIARVNAETEITITTTSGKQFTNTIEEWLIWRREVYRYDSNKGQWRFIEKMVSEMYDQRSTGRGATVAVWATDADKLSQKRDINVISHISDVELLEMQEDLSDIDERLDGMLSLKNAQITIEIP